MTVLTLIVMLEPTSTLSFFAKMPKRPPKTELVDSTNIAPLPFPSARIP